MPPLSDFWDQSGREGSEDKQQSHHDDDAAHNMIDPRVNSSESIQRTRDAMLRFLRSLFLGRD